MTTKTLSYAAQHVIDAYNECRETVSFEPETDELALDIVEAVTSEGFPCTLRQNPTTITVFLKERRFTPREEIRPKLEIINDLDGNKRCITKDGVIVAYIDAHDSGTWYLTQGAGAPLQKRYFDSAQAALDEAIRINS